MPPKEGSEVEAETDVEAEADAEAEAEVAETEEEAGAGVAEGLFGIRKPGVHPPAIAVELEDAET